MYIFLIWERDRKREIKDELGKRYKEMERCPFNVLFNDVCNMYVTIIMHIFSNILITWNVKLLRNYQNNLIPLSAILQAIEILDWIEKIITYTESFYAAY